MSPLTPITGNLGRKRAAHLLRRATFGPTKADIDAFAALTIDQAIDILFDEMPDPLPPKDPQTANTWLNPKATESNSGQDDLMKYFMGWHIGQMINSGNNIRERLTFFLHTHLPAARTVIRSSEALYYQNSLFRYYALGSFKELFRKICIDNAMLVYIDGALNDYGSPNENFAREMFELYTIGRGQQMGMDDYTNYTEDDIKAAARVLSGFKNDTDFTNIDEDTGIPIGILQTNANDEAIRHDPGVKQFSTAFQNTVIQPSEISGGMATADATHQELDELMDMIFAQPETSKFLVRKLYRFFVYYKITEDVEQNIITPLANIFSSNNFELGPVVEQLLKSEHFFDEDNAVTSDDKIGAIIKSPVDLVISTIRFFSIDMPDIENDLNDYYLKACNEGILSFFSSQGLNFYEPLDVAGYDAYYQVPDFNRYWITTISLAYRYKFAERIIAGQTVNGGNGILKLDVLAYVDNPAHISDPSDSEGLVHELLDDLFPVEVDEERFDYFHDILTDGLTMTSWLMEWNNNFKTNNNPEGVRTQLERLFNAIMQSPEYQLM